MCSKGLCSHISEECPDSIYKVADCGSVQCWGGDVTDWSFVLPSIHSSPQLLAQKRALLNTPNSPWLSTVLFPLHPFVVLPHYATDTFLACSIHLSQNLSSWTGLIWNHVNSGITVPGDSHFKHLFTLTYLSLSLCSAAILNCQYRYVSLDRGMF